MSNYCIICEFNPLHNGHAYLINKARELGAEKVICIMSGCSTQRGELAVIDKYRRAEAAVKCGADIVLELPYPWSSSSAEYFAMAGVSIACHFGDKLLFGSECGDVELLKKAASICETDDFRSEYARRTENGEGAAAAFLTELEKRSGSKFLSNDLLGISYIRAINKLGVPMDVATVSRVGAAYNDKIVSSEGFQSATALRNCIFDNNDDAVKDNVPEEMWKIICEERESGQIIDMSEIESFILGYFRLKNGAELEYIAECGGGIANRICDTARTSTNIEQMLDGLKTKRYTDGKLRRTMLYCLTGVEQNHLSALPEYTTLLACNQKGRELLAANRKEKAFTVVTKPADAPKTSFQYVLTERLESIYLLASKNKRSADFLLKQRAFIDIE